MIVMPTTAPITAAAIVVPGTVIREVATVGNGDIEGAAVVSTEVCAADNGYVGSVPFEYMLVVLSPPQISVSSPEQDMLHSESDFERVPPMSIELPQKHWVRFFKPEIV